MLQLNILLADSIDITDTASTISTLDRLFEQLLDHAISLGIKITAAVVVFIIGRWLIKWLRRFFDRFLNRRHIEKTVRSFLDSLINITLQLVLFLMIVNVLGIQTTSFAAIIAAAGLAIGMSMKDNLSNFAGGVMLLINKPFRVGDRVVAQGSDGTVQSIGILYTVLLTGDNITIFLPNGPLSTGSITNYSAQKDRRVDITFNINYGADINEVKDILSSIIKSNSLIKQDPAPFVGVTTVNNGTIDITIRAWVNSGDYSTVSVGLNEEIYSTLSSKGIYVPSSLSVRMIKD
ncbi:mechanosensitive ion channel family protein [Dysgonomonas sp. 511]|uniref:mechanosensitive ion channel family protein n=1 Tax=Dysgonomonas sp. 511 TaxID=2302930 RepID=UPI0013D2D44B|nr:mechanosensitive ion channel family protein [Dysgonomonas sp. 511]NDV79359.1 mechanosensitive ion channel family protein [Dysgonomonas sp. 511]